MSKKTHYPKTSILFHTYYYILKHQISNFSPYNAIHLFKLHISNSNSITQF